MRLTTLQKRWHLTVRIPAKLTQGGNRDTLTAAATGCVVDKCGIDVATGTVLPATKQFCANVDTSIRSSPDTTETDDCVGDVRVDVCRVLHL
ncbi:hypothetical protein CONLIGDRAFT_685821 [Coniochaeta ligniaria NRRL 30616]|uniref:Uncharacterized protein n=1 Tax=Coniochaeta ligniaria NRRL 30616 TaxID=1408157 RepID=A0A1J7J9I5_9PEZI|nr:hypothetical protein CONLIGDRAFT_685821 [Coniochaeta ligniaria NRRL 30616]